MTNKQHIFFGGHSAILHSMLVPIFAFVFTLLYNPFGTVETLQMEHASYSFNLTIIFCIFLFFLFSAGVPRSFSFVEGRCVR